MGLEFAFPFGTPGSQREVASASQAYVRCRSGDRTWRGGAGIRAKRRAINLHFHDLRREFGSRVLESGSSLIEARDLLGHANITRPRPICNRRPRPEVSASAREREVT